MYDNLSIGRASDIAAIKDRRTYRLLEIMPGFLSWGTLILVVAFSYTIPVVAAFFIIVFDVYWFIKTLYLSLHLRIAYGRLKKNLKIDWSLKLKELEPKDYTLGSVNSWQDIHHLIFLPVYNEPYRVIEASIESIAKSNYPKDSMSIVLCWEERGGEGVRHSVREIESKYGPDFFKFLTVMHPDGLPGEIKGKSANATYGAKIAKKEIIDRLNIPYDKVLVSNFDVDTVVFPDYFSILTYTFLTSKNSLRSSYQPIPLYANNIWEAPSFSRVVAFSATFWHTINQERPESAATFSSHSMPLQALLDVGYWQTNMVNEDSRIFWQCFLRYDGDYRTVSLYYPVSMDANVASTNWKTFINIYKQQRRWAYGVDNVPYFIFGFIKNKSIKLSTKLFQSFTAIERFHSLATNALIIFILGWLPLVIGGPEFNETVLSFNLPQFTRTIMSLAMIGLVTSAVLAIALLPPRPPQFGRLKYFWMAVQWILFPATFIFLGSLPGLDAQTRLMLGKYMGFWVTPKEKHII